MERWIICGLRFDFFFGFLEMWISYEVRKEELNLIVSSLYTQFSLILYKKNDSIFNSRFKLLYDKICKYCIVQFLWILFIIRCNQNYILFNHKVVVDEIWQDEMSFLFFKFIFSRTLEEIY